MCTDLLLRIFAGRVEPFGEDRLIGFEGNPMLAPDIVPGDGLLHNLACAREQSRPKSWGRPDAVAGQRPRDRKSGGA